MGKYYRFNGVSTAFSKKEVEALLHSFCNYAQKGGEGPLTVSSVEELLTAFFTGYDAEQQRRVTMGEDSATPATLHYPASLLPCHDVMPERRLLDVKGYGEMEGTPDIKYDRGWANTDTAFYFPVHHEFAATTLNLLLRVVCKRDEDFVHSLATRKFRAGYILAMEDGFTIEQLRECRLAARVVLYGFGTNRSAVQNPLDSMGGAIALYTNYYWSIGAVCRSQGYGNMPRHRDITIDNLLNDFDFEWRPFKEILGHKYLPKLALGDKYFAIVPREGRFK